LAKKLNTINMLILDPSSNDAEQTVNILRNSGHAVRSTQIVTEEDLQIALEKQPWELFVVRDKLPGFSAEQCFKIVQHFGSDVPFIMTTTEYSVERTVKAMRLGFRDVVPEDNDEFFKLVIERELSNIEDKRRRKRADRALVETDRRNELLLDSSRDAIAYITDGMHIHVNHTYMELFGYEETDDLECMPIMDLMESEQHDAFKKYLKDHSKGDTAGDFEFVGLNVKGSTFAALLSLSDSKYDGEDCTQVLIKLVEDNDEELEQKLKELSALDRLTGLYNQHYFLDTLTEAISKANTNNQLSAVYYLELDNFDQIRDEHGITNSDLYLKEVSQWLTENLSDDTILARVGDSTFTLLSAIEKPEDSTILATDLCKKFSSQMFEASALTITDTLSIGICPIVQTSTDADKTLSNAHIASSRVQSKGGNGVRLHDNSLDSLDNREDAKTAMELQDARDAGRIHVIYEPIVKLHGDIEQIFHAKLSIDTEEAENQLLDEAFKIDHRTAIALKLDQWLLEESFSEFKQQLTKHPDCMLKVQLSAASLLDDNLVSSLCGQLSQNNIPETAVIFEFREHEVGTYLKRAMSLVKDMGQNNLISALSCYGKTDDSQSIIDSIKCDSFSWVSIELSLLVDFISNADAQGKVQELVTHAQTNELTTVAPNISDPGTLATLWPMNVGHIHGEYIASANNEMDFDFSEVSF